MEDDLLAIGKVINVTGIEGELIVECLTDFPSRFKPALKLYITPPLPELEKVTIERVREKKSKFVVKFEEIDSREKGESLKGHLLNIHESKGVPLDKGEYWFHEIIGLDCYTDKGSKIGVVSDILRSEGNDIYLVKGATSKKNYEILVPARKEYIKKIDIDKSEIIVKNIEPLLPKGFKG